MNVSGYFNCTVATEHFSYHQATSKNFIHACRGFDDAEFSLKRRTFQIITTEIKEL